jgi:large subunit ribosomal protein L30e
MAKEKVDKDVALIRKLVGTPKLVIGTERTIKALKLGRIEKIYLASNCVEDVERDIQHYGKLSKASVLKLNYPNDELGMLCKKPFSISIIGIIKEKTK